MKNQNQRLGLHMLHRFVFLAALALGVNAQAQTVIESVTASVQGGTEVVRIDLSKALAAVPTGFSIQSPARIALDFPGVTSAVGRSNIDINQGNLKSASVVQAGERTRVVLNLKYPTAYTAEIQGKSLLVVLETVSPSTPAATVASTFAESRSRDSAPLKDLDFRRTTDGAGRVVVTLPNNQVGVDIRQQGQTLVVDFMKSTLPEGMRRRLDVTDFGTPIKSVTTTQTGDRVRMVIEPAGQWEHSAYQSDEQFVIEVKEIKIDPKKLTQGVGYTGQKLSLNFQNIEVRSLLQVIADFTNFNIVTSDSVSGSVTLRLQDVPWDQALDIILQAKGLGLRKSGNVLWVAPKDEIAAKEKLDLESVVAVQGLEPLRTQSFQINYAKAEEIAAYFRADGGGEKGAARILSTRGSVIAEKRTNQLFVTDIPSKLEQIQVLIAKLDIAVRQVLIEARIVEATDTFGKSLGVKLGGYDARAKSGGDGGYQINGDNRVAFGASYANVTKTSDGLVEGRIVSSGPGGEFLTMPAVVNYPALSSPAQFAVSIFNASANRFLNLEISALEADGKGKVVSSPRVVTADQVQAIIEQGEELPYQVASASGATSIAFRKANLKLEVTPQITPEGSIILKLDVTKDTVGRLTTAGFAIDTKHIKTEVLVENGGTVVIGGIYAETTKEDETRVPLLGELPVVGNLFKTKARSTSKTELLVFITPKLISDRGATR
ncbi:type IV pilus secretin PilQ [Rhodoferax sp. AJA081-3]|uniref:type IV pilus secretin PilQ n=1 Tax=Rhodoferax sp. AJA081-3 TaxID=2752316 RepID=UPI001ADF67FE|nr:type IV pilus secretin PilQ [Rhodoferax sp. AJA081-3]